MTIMAYSTKTRNSKLPLLLS